MQVNIPEVRNIGKGIVVKTTDYCFANGSCADIWKARYSGKAVAVKVWRGVPYTEASKKTFNELLSRELGIWNRLRHKNIVSFYGLVEEYGHLPGLVLPFFKNGTMNEYLRRNVDTLVFPLIKDIASALSYMQTIDPPVCHGELKGSNIFIDDNGRALLCDFGSGSIKGEMNFTSANICGSCRWTAPEIMIPSDDVPFIPMTPASDVYSFAMTMVETYTRKSPFSHIRNDTAVIFAAIDGRRPRRPLPDAAPQLSDEVWELMELCWAHDANSRPSAGTVFHWLESLELLNRHLPDTKVVTVLPAQSRL